MRNAKADCVGQWRKPQAFEAATDCLLVYSAFPPPTTKSDLPLDFTEPHMPDYGANDWYLSMTRCDLWDGKTVCGPAGLRINVPLKAIPVYLKQGAAVPVQLNRELLPRLNATEFNSMPMGWQADSTGNRLLICLPSARVPLVRRQTEIEVNFNASQK